MAGYKVSPTQKTNKKCKMHSNLQETANAANPNDFLSQPRAEEALLYPINNNHNAQIKLRASNLKLTILQISW